MPTLGEIAAINAGVFAGQENDPIKIASNITTLQRGQQALQKEQYDYEQKQHNDALDIVSSVYQNPAWKSNDPYQIAGVIDSTRKQLQSRNIPVSRGGILDQLEEQVFRAAEMNDPRLLEGARSLLRDSVNQMGGNRAANIQPTFDANRREVTEREIGGGVGLSSPRNVPPPGGVPPGSQVPTTPGATAAPTTPATRTGPGFQLAYPNARPNQFAVEPNEEPERQFGLQQRQNSVIAQIQSGERLNTLNRAMTTINDLDKDRILQTGKGANIQKWFAENLKGDPRYQALSKEIADIELQELKNAQGAINTVAGLDLQKKANGTELYSPEVLQKIIYKRAGQALEEKARADAIVNFASVHGDQNIRSFQTEWAKYNDPLIFQISYVQSLGLGQAAEQAAINDLIKTVPIEQLKQLQFKRNKLKELGAIR